MSESGVSKRAALMTAATAAFLTPFMASSVNVALPLLAAEFAIDAVVLTWIPAAYLLASAMFLLPFGRMADIYGRKKFFLCGLIIFTVSSFLSALANSALELIILRFVQGIGSALVFGTGMAILSSVFPPNERGRAFGFTVAAVYVGLSAGPLIGGVLTEHLGWRSVFLFAVPLGLVAVLKVITGLPGEWAEAKGERFDWKGSIFYSLALMLLASGFSQFSDGSGLALFISGIIMLIFFFFLESRIKNPLLDISVFRRNKVFAYSNLAALINYGATSAIVFMMSLYLQYIRLLTPQTAGLILVCQPVTMAFLSPIAGKLSDRIEPRIVASVGMILTTVGLGMLTFLDYETSWFYVMGCLLLLGMGLAFFSSPNTNAVMSSVGKKQYGLASGTVGTMRLVGQMLSMGIAMMILSFFIGREQIVPDNHPEFLFAMKSVFFISALICFFGIFASFARGEIHDREIKET